MDFLKQAQGALGGMGGQQQQQDGSVNQQQQGGVAGQPGQATGQMDALGKFSAVFVGRRRARLPALPFYSREK